MSDLSDTLREGGHPELARQLERKELAGRLRGSGRDDLAASLETPEAPAEKPEAKSPEQVVGEELLGAPNAALSRWHSL